MSRPQAIEWFKSLSLPCGSCTTDTDGDNIADCGDPCPADPLKTDPGTCGCGVADTDTDLDGTADCNDLCATDPLKVDPGTCGCGALEPGSVCDDLNPATVNDLVDAACTCTGTPVQPATERVVLKLRKDANGSQTQWALADSNGTVIRTGGPYANGPSAWVQDTVDLVPGCYSFTVIDLAGNGLNSSGYTLSTIDNWRMLKATGTFTDSSTVRDAQYADFCVPLGALRLKAQWCDKVSISAGTTIRTPKVNGATSYEFWLFDPHGSFSHHEVRTENALPLGNLAGNQLPEGLSLNVRVRAFKSGVWQPFGRSCTLLVPAAMSPLDTVDIDELESERTAASLVLHPNPSSGRVDLAIEGIRGQEAQRALVTVVSELGRTLFEQVMIIQDGRLGEPLDLDHLSPGVYMVQVLVDGTGYQSRLLLVP